MAKKYRKNIEPEKRLDKTVGIIFNENLLSRVNNYANRVGLEDYSFSFVVREMITKYLDQFEKDNPDQEIKK